MFLPLQSAFQLHGNCRLRQLLRPRHQHLSATQSFMGITQIQQMAKLGEKKSQHVGSIHGLSQPWCPRDAQESGWGTLGSFAGLSGGSRCSAPGSGTRKGCSFSIFASPAWGGESARPRAPTPASKALSPRQALLMPARWSNMNNGTWGKGRHGCWSQDLAAQFCPPFCVTLDKSLPLSRPPFPSVT